MTETLPSGIVIPYSGGAWPPTTRPLDNVPLPPPWMSAIPSPINVDVGRQLFTDDFLVATSNATRTWYAGTQDAANPVIPAGSITYPYSIPFSDDVVWDPYAGKWRAWYLTNLSPGQTALAESADGKVWTLPDWGYIPGTNVVLTHGAKRRDSGRVYIDAADIPARRYKMIVNEADEPGPYNFQLTLYYSSDGVAWGAPVVRSGGLGNLSDRNTFFWNPFRSKWVFSLRWITGGVSRHRRYMEGTDLEAMLTALTDVSAQVNWWETDTNDLPNPIADLAQPDLYNIDAVAYESIMLNLLSVHDGESLDHANKMNKVEAGYSRDGFYIDRAAHQVIAFNTNSDADWNTSNCQSTGSCVQVVGDKLYLFITGRGQPRGGALGLWTLRRDGFCSLDAGAAEKTVRTRPLKWTLGQNYLFMNADASAGYVRAEVLDAFGNEIGIRFPPLYGDNTKHLCLTCPESTLLARLSGQTVSLRFTMANAKLYSFWLGRDAAGASGGYVPGPG